MKIEFTKRPKVDNEAHGIALTRKTWRSKCGRWRIISLGGLDLPTTFSIYRIAAVSKRVERETRLDRCEFRTLAAAKKALQRLA